MATAVLAAAVVVLPLAASTPQEHRPTTNEAEWLVRQFEATEWRADYQAWRKKHAAAGCREFHGDGSSLFIPDLWSYRCISLSGSARVNRFFYILNSTNPPESRLDQFLGEIWESRDVPLSTVQRMHNRIEALLIRQYGQPEAPDTTPAGVVAWGSGDWRLLRVWHLPDREVYLYIRKTPGQRVAVGLLARDRSLDLASREEGQQLLLELQPSTVVEDQIDSRLSAALAKDFPTASEMLGDTDTQPSSDAVYDAASEMSRVALSATPELRPMLLLAADRLVSRWRLPEQQKLPSGLDARVKQLGSTAGAHFAWNSLDDSWSYQHDLLWSAWRAAPESEWGQDAFFLLLASGWDTSGVCHNGTDQFRTVIEQGQKFLASNPSSPLRLPVTYLLAEAYETWWSLSEWSSCSPVIDLGPSPCRASPASARYQSDAEAARQQAIADYEALLASDPSIYGTPALRRRLARLKLGIDTNQRQFYCLYD
ncbi:MAG: hypothetical protein KGL59_14525 [Acidobacteriota bacterium]|nr:hypothetical protein [Acidobacteriota bacterium]